MSWPPLVAALSVALAVIGVGLVVAILAGHRRLRASGTESDAAAASAMRSGFQRIAEQGRGVERWFGEGGEDTGQLLVRAGWRSPAAQNLFYFLQAGLPVAALLLVCVSWLLGGGGGVQLFLYGFLGGALGLLAPRYFLRHAVSERQARIRGEVPTLINLMVMLLEANLSTRQALHSLVRDGGGVLPVLSGEFRLALRQIDAGGDLGEVLQAMARTHEVAELSGVLAVLRQVERYGGEIREPLLAALAVIEERRSLTLRERVGRLSGTMTIVMVVFFFPELLIAVAGPAVLAILKVFGS
jgi:tight adherence protein C